MHAMNLETVRREALALPLDERAALAEQLLSSLDELSESEVEQLWSKEAARRATQIDQGQVELLSSETFEREVQALLR